MLFCVACRVLFSSHKHYELLLVSKEVSKFTLKIMFSEAGVGLVEETGFSTQL